MMLEVDEKLRELKELSDQLAKLLADPHPGLFTWALLLFDVTWKIGQTKKNFGWRDEMTFVLKDWEQEDYVVADKETSRVIGHKPRHEATSFSGREMVAFIVKRANELGANFSCYEIECNDQ